MKTTTITLIGAILAIGGAAILFLAFINYMTSPNNSIGDKIVMAALFAIVVGLPMMLAAGERDE